MKKVNKSHSKKSHFTKLRAKIWIFECSRLKKHFKSFDQFWRENSNTYEKNEDIWIFAPKMNISVLTIFERISNTVFKDILVPHFKKQFSSNSVSFCLFLILFFHSTRGLGNWKKSRVSANMAYSATSTVPLLFSSAALVASIAAFATSSLNDFKVPWEASGTENTTKN